MNLGPQFSPTMAADRRSRRRNLGPTTLAANETGLADQLPELTKAARRQPNGGWAQDREKFARRVSAGKALPQHPAEHEAYNSLQAQLGAALGRQPTKADYREHFGVATDAEVRTRVRQHVGLE